MLIAIAAALAVTMIGCSFSVSTAKIEDAIMTDSIDAEGRPGMPVTSYSADTAVFYTSAKLHSAPDHTQIRIVWTYLTDNQLIDEIKIDSETMSDRYIYSNLTPSSPFPAGDYQVQYFIDERKEPDATVKFEVVPVDVKANEAPVAIDGAFLEDAHMTSNVDAEGCPVDSIDTLPTTGTWFVSAVLRNAQPDTLLNFVWYDLIGNIVDSYDFDPAGATDVYIFGSLQLTATAPEGQYRVEIYIDDAAMPAAAVDFAVMGDGQAAAASSVDFSQYIQNEGGFSISYPSDWNLQEYKEEQAAVFYPVDYVIDDADQLNTVYVYSVADIAAGYTLDTLTQAWVSETEGENHTNYKNVSQTTATINGNDMSVFEYSWTDGSYDAYTMDFLAIKDNNMYVISFVSSQSALDTLYPLVEQMVLSFQIL